MHWVYILKSIKNGRYYIGCTKNLENRLIEHNSGETKGIRYLIPFELVYKECYNTLPEARKRERYLKSKKSRKYLERLINRGVAQFGLERLVWDQEVGGSNPLAPII